MPEISFQLRPLPPFRLDFTVWVLRRRAENIWDRWDGQVYQRVLVLDGRPVELAVRQTSPFRKPVLRVSARGPRLPADLEGPLRSTLEKMLGLRMNLSPFYRLASKDDPLKTLARRFRGMKPPRYPSVFEAMVNAITCQQFTLTAGIRLLARLVVNLGASIPGPGERAYAFPRPEDLAGAEVETLRQWGFSYQKARAITDLARMVRDKRLDLEALQVCADETAIERLRELRGVGRWTAEYTLLRGLGRVHIFPGDDVGARNKLQRWLDVKSRLDYEGVRKILTPWGPYGGLIYFHLLLNSLAEASILPDRSSR